MISIPARSIQNHVTDKKTFRCHCQICGDPVATDAPGAVYEHDNHGELEFFTCAPCGELQDYRDALGNAFKPIIAAVASAAPVGLESDYAEILEFAAQAANGAAPPYHDTRAAFEAAKVSGAVSPNGGVDLVDLLTTALTKTLEPRELDRLGRALVHGFRARSGRAALESGAS
jgi:hypothetical protein